VLFPQSRRDALRIKERVQAVVSGSELLLVTVDQDLKLSLVEGKRPSFLPEFDENESIVGRPFGELFPSSELGAAVQRVLGGSAVEEVEVTTESRDGTLHHRYRVRLCLAPVPLYVLTRVVLPPSANSTSSI
jgi:hypothetical protein